MIRKSEICTSKDAEDELGIDLVTLVKALINGIWSKGGFYDPCSRNNEPTFIEPHDIEIGTCDYYEDIGKEECIRMVDQLCLYTYDYDYQVYEVRVKDYGKTWALTREELE